MYVVFVKNNSKGYVNVKVKSAVIFGGPQNKGESDYYARCNKNNI